MLEVTQFPLPLSLFHVLFSILFAALRSTNGDYIINGNYTVSPSGPYEVAGTTIFYHRFDGNAKETHQHKRSDGVTEWITGEGPLYEPIYLMVRLELDSYGMNILIEITFALLRHTTGSITTSKSRHQIRVFAAFVARIVR